MITRCVARNLVALKRSKAETRLDHLARLQFELFRRTRQLINRLNPLYRDQYRREKLCGPMAVWDDLQRYQLEVLTDFGIAPHHSVLDIGCGPLTAGLGLIRHLDRGRYVGIDVRPAPLIEAYRLVAEHGLVDKNPAFVHSATFGRDELGERTFDFVWVSQLSYHLADSQVADLFGQIRARTCGASLALIDVIDPEIELGFHTHWSGFPYHVRPYAFFEAAAQAAGLSPRWHGRIADYGYPAAINLSANRLLALHRAA